MPFLMLFNTLRILRRIRVGWCLVTAGWISTEVAAAPLPAFPGAEGAGKWAVGGRGGRVIQVTHLRDAGAGSLRAAVEASGRRTVVFRVAGTIVLKSRLRVKNPFLTLAGQSAPGEGITVAGNEFRIEADEVIVRYLRFRPGDVSGADVDAVSVAKGKRIILDHLSASWGVDETLSVSDDARDVTVQNCLISESLHDSVHSSGNPHGKGSLLRGRRGARISFFQNLYAHHVDRSPMIQGVDSVLTDPEGVRLDFRNNVIYDWGSVGEGWEAAGANRNRQAAARANFIANSYLAGPSTQAAFLPIQSFPFFAYRFWAFEELSSHARAHWAGNTFNHALWRNGSNQLDPTWMVSVPNSVPSSYFLADPVGFSTESLPHTDAESALERVMKTVGASRVRDLVDLRVLAQVRNRTGRMIDSQDDVGGWPMLKTGPVPPDRDRDGLPDEWERVMGLNPDNSSDAGRLTSGGRTWLERYLEQRLDPGAIRLRLTWEGPGSVSGNPEPLAIGDRAAIEILPALGYVVETITLNGRKVMQSELDALQGWWSDTSVHVVFVKPRIPMPVEFAENHVALIERDDSAPLLAHGGALSLLVTSKGSASGRLWLGKSSWPWRGTVISREGDLPRLQTTLRRNLSQPWQLEITFSSAPEPEIRGALIVDGATLNVGGWRSPWRLRSRLVLEQWRGSFEGQLLPESSDSESAGSVGLQVLSHGLVRIRARMEDGSSAVRSTRLGSRGEVLLWTPPGLRRAALHGAGSLEENGKLNGAADWLTVGGISRLLLQGGRASAAPAP